VSFAYGPSAAPVIDDLSLRVIDGDHLAVVGPSGIGKSTLSLLAAGLLTPSGGTVTLGGVPATEADPALRALIPQEAYVFGGTLRENLCYLRPGVADHAVDDAVAAVGLGTLAGRLGGYDATVDPATLSAGERQLIALVRRAASPSHPRPGRDAGVARRARGPAHGLRAVPGAARSLVGAAVAPARRWTRTRELSGVRSRVGRVVPCSRVTTSRRCRRCGRRRPGCERRSCR